MRDRVPDEISLAWFMQNRKRVRDALTHTEKDRIIVGPDGQLAPAKSARESVNVLYDLRITETSADPLPIAPPVLSLTVDDADQELDLEWTLPETYNELFLERSDDDGATWTPIATLPGTQDAYEDADVTPGTTYSYRIRGRVGGAYSAFSNVVSGELTAAAGFALFATGWTGYGQYGNGTTTPDFDELAAIGVDTTWTKIATGLEFSIGIKSDGTLWSTGRNLEGQLGQGDFTQRTSWTQIGSDTNWADVQCGEKFAVARKTTGAIYAWGNNDYGQLGQGDTAIRESPTQIGAATDWGAIATGDFHVLALKDTDELWAWGNGDNGQIGDGNATDTLSPVQIAGAWTSVGAGETHSFGVKTAGTLWGWGNNMDGQLGLGSTLNTQDTPQQVGSDTNWHSATGGETFSVARKTTGAIYSCGYGSSGQLGRGGTTSATTFGQIGSDTTWDQIVGCQVGVRAHKSDGTIWAWGQNGFGELGTGDFTNRNVPWPIASLDYWQSIHSRYYTTFALKTP